MIIGKPARIAALHAKRRDRNAEREAAIERGDYRWVELANEAVAYFTDAIREEESDD